jgi:hypothetical protein
MPTLLVEITRFVDEYQPGFVECVFVDAFDRSHFIVEKAPVISTEDLWSTSSYPRPGEVACEVVAEWLDEAGQSLVRVNTDRPWGIESTTGASEFVVFSHQVAGQ